LLLACRPMNRHPFGVLVEILASLHPPPLVDPFGLVLIATGHVGEPVELLARLDPAAATGRPRGPARRDPGQRRTTPSPSPWC
jgi:hypothetical protein